MKKNTTSNEQNNQGNQNNTKEKLKKYTSPKLKVYGSVKDFTQTFSMGGGTDGGSTPYDKHMCITAAPVIEEHRVLLQDPCQEAYLEEILNLVKKDMVVLDLGTGSGIHTLFALKAGAKKVYAIEADPLIEITKQVIKDNGYEDKVTFLFGNSSEVTLPEKVDAIIANLGFLGNLENINDVVQRFLKPDGVVLPSSARLSFAPVEHDAFHNKYVKTWENKKYDFDFSAFKHLATNYPHYSLIDEKSFIATPCELSPIDYTKEIPKQFVWKMNFKFDRDCTMTGFAGWYSFQSNGKTFISTKPPLKMSHELWSQIYLPLGEPTHFKKGEQVECEIHMYRKLAYDGPVWRWIVSQNGNTLYDQSNFKGMPLSDQILQKLQS